MLNVGFKNNFPNKYPIYSNNTQQKIINPKISQRLRNDSFVSFKGNADFVLVNKLIPPISNNLELKHISNILKTIGVKELEIGDNLDLAKLLKSAMCRVKRLGFNVPTRIKCESTHFNENERIQKKLQESIANNKDCIAMNIPATTQWNGIEEPIMHFNPEHDWKSGNGNLTEAHDPRHIIMA